MRRGLVAGATVVVVVLLAVGGAIFWARRGDGATPGAGSPKAGDCFQADPAQAAAAFPWPSAPVACTGAHTVEIVYAGQAPAGLVKQAKASRGEERTVADNLMFAHARSTCQEQADAFLGGSWHTARVAVLANWVKPDRSGYFACGVAETSGPAASAYVTRQATLRSQPPKIECVARSGSALGYTPCTARHDGEFVGIYTVTPMGAPYVEAGVRRTVQQGCAELVAAHLGLPKGGSRPDLYAGYVGPTEATSWLGSDQTFTCYAMTQQGSAQLSASVRGLGTRPLPG